MRGRVVYGYVNEENEMLSYFGRDPAFLTKQQEWIRKGRPEKGKPMKHRFVKGFHRGLELYGQNFDERLNEERLQSSLRSHGLIVVEGSNDVIRLDCLNSCAVGLCSNKATDEQIIKIVQFAKEHSAGQVVLMPDCDPEGEAGFKELLWKLSQQQGIKVKLAWTSEMHDGQFMNRQPESISSEDWDFIQQKI